MAPSSNLVLFGALTLLAVFRTESAWGERHRPLIIKSAFIKHHSQLTNTRSEVKLTQETENHNTYAALMTRGGASSSYDSYNDGYGYDANSNYDGYKYENDPYNQYQNRYEEDYYPSGNDGYYDDEGRYHEDYDDRGDRRSRRKRSSSQKLPTVLTSGNRKLGILFLSAGAAFTALGITLFFNKTLMRLGNLLFVGGIPLMIGPGRTLGYFLQPKKARATGCLVSGIFLVLVGHPVIGILLEIFGLLNLFGNMFPVLLIMAKNLPVVGSFFGDNGSSAGKRRRQDDRYESDRYRDDDYSYRERDY